MTALFIVEDEGIVAEGLRLQLESLGYTVKGTAYSGEEAVQLIPADPPDVVLMDIMLAGEMDGIQTADILRQQHQLPVIFLSAYSDRATLDRARIAEPFGYLVKPYREQDLRSTIEMTLYKHQMDAQIRQQKAQLDLILNSIEDGVIQIDEHSHLTYLNPAAAMLVGTKTEEMLGKSFTFLLQVDDRFQFQKLRALVQEVREGERLHGGLDDLRIQTSDGSSKMLQVWVSPLQQETHGHEGCLLTFRDITQREEAAAAAEARRRELTDMLTPREREVLQLIVNGRATKAIADTLHISARTVEAHRRNIFTKFDLHDIPTLVRFSIQHHLVSLSD
jgi:PAS domain S-box-containing protein